MTPDELRTKVAEALYSAGSVILSWDEIKDSPHGQRLFEQADAVLPLILDAATARIDEAYQQMHDSLHGGRHKPDTRGQDFLDGMEHSQVAIDSLRTKP